MRAENKINAVIGNWVRARSLGVRDGVDFQSTGTAEKIELNLIDKVLVEGLIPIFPCIGWSSTGNPYNISSNELAAILNLHEAEEFLKLNAGNEQKSCLEIIDIALKACRAGVNRAHIVDFALTIHRLWRWLCPDGYAVRCSAESRNS